MTTPLSGPDIPKSLETRESDNRVFTLEQVRENLARLEGMYQEHYTFLDKTWVNGELFENPFTWENHAESVQNIREQWSMVVLVAEKLANALAGRGLISEAQRDAVMQWAILHNSLKRFEIFMRAAYPQFTPYSPEWVAALKSKVVDEKNILTSDEFDACVALRNTMGHGSLKDFVKIEDGEVVLSEKGLLKMIVHVASDMVWLEWWVAQISSFSDRAKFSDFEKRYSWMWKKGFLLKPDGSVTDDIVKPDILAEWEIFYTYYEWQDLVFQMISDHIANMLDLKWSSSGSDKLLWIINTPAVNTVASGAQIDTAEILDNVTLGLRNSLIQVWDTLLKASPGTYVFRLWWEYDTEINRFLDVNAALLGWVQLVRVVDWHENRRTMDEANDANAGFSIKIYKVTAANQALWNHYHTMTAWDNSLLSEAFVIREWSGILVTKSLPDGDERQQKFQAGDGYPSTKKCCTYSLVWRRGNRRSACSGVYMIFTESIWSQ